MCAALLRAAPTESHRSRSGVTRRLGLPGLLPNARGDDEVLGRAAVGLVDQFQRLDQRNFDVFLGNQGGERLGGDFLEVGEFQRAFARGEGFGDGDGVVRVKGGDERHIALQ